MFTTPYQLASSGLSGIEAAARKDNSFGFLRLLFAVCVILSHSFELVDGDRSREPLTLLFGTISLGELAVDGFFLISGYLITNSLLHSQGAMEYLWKRVLRIYPGFIVAFFISLLVVGPLAGGYLTDLMPIDYAKQTARAFTLNRPNFPGAFADLPFPSLNSPMWTVAYEFRCYLFVLLLGIASILKQRKLFLGLLASVIILWMGGVNYNHSFASLAQVTGDLDENLRFISIFMCGASFYLFRDKITYRGSLALVAAVALVPLMFFRPFAELGVATCGAYILFWFAFAVPSRFLNGVGRRNDISYGVYLYAWPIQNLIVLQERNIHPLLLFVLAVTLAMGMGYLSWKCVEQPCLRLKNRLVWLRTKTDAGY